MSGWFPANHIGRSQLAWPRCRFQVTSALCVPPTDIGRLQAILVNGDRVAQIAYLAISKPIVMLAGPPSHVVIFLRLPTTGAGSRRQRKRLIGQKNLNLAKDSADAPHCGGQMIRSLEDFSRRRSIEPYLFKIGPVRDHFARGAEFDQTPRFHDRYEIGFCATTGAFVGLFSTEMRLSSVEVVLKTLGAPALE